MYSAGSKYFRGHFIGNAYDGDIPDDQWSLVRLGEDWSESEIMEYKREKAFSFGMVRTENVMDAYTNVLAHAGASLPQRDPVDVRITEDVKNGTGAIINFETEVGGWPKYITYNIQKDTDKDGMPDQWEKANMLDPADPEDRNGDTDSNGYTNLEEYLNSLTPKIK